MDGWMDAWMDGWMDVAWQMLACADSLPWIRQLQAVIVEDETNREAQALLEECRRNAHVQHANRVLAQVEKAANLAQWQARKSGAQLPKSKKEFVEEGNSLAMSFVAGAVECRLDLTLFN
jgi:hypothetical protein